MDIEKAFDSFDDNSLISLSKKYGIGKSFISGDFKKNFKILIRDQESHVINGRTATKYFLFGRCARQGDHVSTFLFILDSVI